MIQKCFLRALLGLNILPGHARLAMTVHSITLGSWNSELRRLRCFFSTVSQYQLIKAQYVMVCACERTKTTEAQEDVAQYCRYDFLMRYKKTDQLVNKRCNEQFSLYVD